MNHDADSRILETYYLNLAGFTDLTSLGLGQHGTEDDRSSVMAHENHPLALGALALDPQALVKVHGPALNAMMAKLLATSEPEERTEHEERLFRRRVRWVAKKAVLSEESQEMRRTLLTVDYRERVAKLDVYRSPLNGTVSENRELKNKPVQCPSSGPRADNLFHLISTLPPIFHKNTITIPQNFIFSRLRLRMQRDHSPCARIV